SAASVTRTSLLDSDCCTELSSDDTVRSRSRTVRSRSRTVRTMVLTSVLTGAAATLVWASPSAATAASPTALVDRNTLQGAEVRDEDVDGRHRRRRRGEGGGQDRRLARLDEGVAEGGVGERLAGGVVGDEVLLAQVAVDEIDAVQRVARVGGPVEVDQVVVEH